MIPACDNRRKCHDPLVLADGDSAMVVICKECKHSYVIRKDQFRGNPEIRSYVKIFRRDALQGNDNLFYKYYSQHLKQ